MHPLILLAILCHVHGCGCGCFYFMYARVTLSPYRSYPHALNRHAHNSMDVCVSGCGVPVASASNPKLYAHTYTYKHTHTRTHTHTRAHTYTRTHAHTHAHTHLWLHTLLRPKYVTQVHEHIVEQKSLKCSHHLLTHSNIWLSHVHEYVTQIPEYMRNGKSLILVRPYGTSKKCVLHWYTAFRDYCMMPVATMKWCTYEKCI